MSALRWELGLVAAACVGCGSSEAQTAAFIGTWRFNAGSTITAECANGSDRDLTNVELAIVDGAAADLEILDGGIVGTTGCTLRFSVEGGTAAAERDQTCLVGLGGSGCPVVSGTMTQYPFTLELDAGHTQLDVAMQWAGMIGTNGCDARQCMGRAYGSAIKVN